MNQIKFFLSGMALIFSTAACAGIGETKTIDTTEFLDKAVTRDIANVEAGKMALQVSHSPAILAYAQYMINEHTAEHEALTRLADQKHIPMADAAEMQTRIKAFVEKQFDEKSFDVAYAKNQVSTHQRIIQLFRNAVSSEDAEISSYAKNTLPKLLKNLYVAQQLFDSINTDKK